MLPRENPYSALLSLLSNRGDQVRGARWGNTQSSSESRPPGLKPVPFQRTYAALKGRSSTAIHTFVSFSAAYQRLGLPGKPENRDLLLEVLEWVRRRYRFVVVGYVIVPEHIHLLVGEPERGNPCKAMPPF